MFSTRTTGLKMCTCRRMCSTLRQPASIAVKQPLEPEGSAIGSSYGFFQDFHKLHFQAVSALRHCSYDTACNIASVHRLDLIFWSLNPACLLQQPVVHESTDSGRCCQFLNKMQVSADPPCPGRGGRASRGAQALRGRRRGCRGRTPNSRASPARPSSHRQRRCAPAPAAPEQTQQQKLGPRIMLLNVQSLNARVPPT